MCLQSITKLYEKPTTEVRRAWKIINKDGSTPFQDTYLPLGTWVCARVTFNLRETCYGQERPWAEIRTYPCGFHSFPSRDEARKALNALKRIRPRPDSIIVPVEVRGIVAEGTDGTSMDAKFYKLNIKNLVSLEIKRLA